MEFITVFTIDKIYQEPKCNSKDQQCKKPAMDENGNCKNCKGKLQMELNL